MHSEALEKFTAQLGTSQFLLGSALQALARRARFIVAALATRTRCMWHVECWHGVRCIVHLCLRSLCKVDAGSRRSRASYARLCYTELVSGAEPTFADICVYGCLRAIEGLDTHKDVLGVVPRGPSQSRLICSMASPHFAQARMFCALKLSGWRRHPHSGASSTKISEWYKRVMDALGHEPRSVAA